MAHDAIGMIETKGLVALVQAHDDAHAQGSQREVRRLEQGGQRSVLGVRGGETWLNAAIGMIETKGLVALVQATDAMLKAAA